eukprot:5674827-Pyramimonas_sp.AAC.1
MPMRSICLESHIDPGPIDGPAECGNFPGPKGPAQRDNFLGQWAGQKGQRLLSVSWDFIWEVIGGMLERRGGILAVAGVS